MSYRLKGPQVIIEGDINKIVPQTLPVTPVDGQFIIDIADKKLKAWNATLTRWVILGDALDVVFDNATNDFVSTNVQEAIEEARTTAILKPRFSIVTTFNGTVGNDWLGYSELIPGNEVPIRIPLNCKLKEITFAYRDTLLGSASIDGVFRLYKNGFTNPTNVVHTETFTNQNNGKLVSGLSIAFGANDFMVGQWTDTGSNPNDMVIVYFLQVE